MNAWTTPADQAQQTVSGVKKKRDNETVKVSPEVVTNLETRSRVYVLKEFMKAGWLDIVKNLFPTVDIAQQNVTKSSRDGTLSRSLFLHFDDSEDPERALADYNTASRFSIGFGNYKYDLVAVSKDDTDGHGTFIPRIIKQVILKDCPFGLVKSRELFEKTFGDYFEFNFDENPVNLLRKKGVFNGIAHVVVKDFKKIPAKRLNIPAVRWCEASKKYIFDISIGTKTVKVDCRGFDPLDTSLEHEKVGARCQFCGKNGQNFWQGL